MGDHVALSASGLFEIFTNKFLRCYLWRWQSNVAVSLANYGVPVRFVTRVPSNDIGECALMEMRNEALKPILCFVVETVWDLFLETGAVSRGSKVVYDRAHSAMSEIEPGMVDWDKAFEGVEWFHWTGLRLPSLSLQQMRAGSSEDRQ